MNLNNNCNEEKLSFIKNSSINFMIVENELCYFYNYRMSNNDDMIVVYKIIDAVRLGMYHKPVVTNKNYHKRVYIPNNIETIMNYLCLSFSNEVGELF